jgi:hypothetical protein
MVAKASGQQVLELVGRAALQDIDIDARIE